MSTDVNRFQSIGKLREQDAGPLRGVSGGSKPRSVDTVETAAPRLGGPKERSDRDPTL